jgi:6-phosphogluconate dehydrogenase (decarboxylating) (EC 1.1.1.44)
VSKKALQLGFIGLGRMGLNMVARLQAAGVDCVVFDPNAKARKDAVKHGAAAGRSLKDLVSQLAKPRAVWMMVPTGVVESVLDELVPLLRPAT